MTKPSIDQGGTLASSIMAFLGAFGLAKKYGITADQVLVTLGLIGAVITWVRHMWEKGKASGDEPKAPKGSAAVAVLLVAGLSVFAQGCDRGKLFQVTGCAIKDERLSFAFKSPAKAKAYLDLLIVRLDKGEPGAAEDAADLARRFRDCIDTE